MNLADVSRGIHRAQAENGGRMLDAYAIPAEDWMAVRAELIALTKNPIPWASATCDRVNYLIDGTPIVVAEIA